MSVIINSSILKSKTNNVEMSTRTPGKVRFTLPETENVRMILENYLHRKDVKKYADLINLVKRGDLTDDELCSLLLETRNCVSLLSQDVSHFVEAILKLRWAHRSKIAVKQYQKFIFDLLSAHNYYVKIAVDNLILNFVPDADEAEWENGVPSDPEYNKYLNVHLVLNVLLKVIPISNFTTGGMSVNLCVANNIKVTELENFVAKVELTEGDFWSENIIFESLAHNFPYYKRSAHHHEVYLNNLLWVLDYKPESRVEIFTLIVQKLIILDVNAPRDLIVEADDDMDTNVFVMDEDEPASDTKNTIIHSLDICLHRIFLYLSHECHDPDTGQLNWDKAKNMYFDFIKIFENVIMPTFESHHVQFIMFYLCSFKVTLAEGFLNFLWKKVTNVTLAVVHRQTAIAYLASLLARAAYIPLSMLKRTLEQMATWIQCYIGNQDGLESLNTDLRIHVVFYTLCQALFYVIAFRHRDLIQSRKDLIFLQSLNLSKIVTCRLNPLRFCTKAVVQNFAAVTRMYQLAYCYSIIENNSRNTHPVIFKDPNGQLMKIDIVIQAYFPFDPYLLSRSKEQITPLYVQYQEIDQLKKARENTSGSSHHENGESSQEMEEDDDFLSENVLLEKNSLASKFNNCDFSYGTSPGFKRTTNL